MAKTAKKSSRKKRQPKPPFWKAGARKPWTVAIYMVADGRSGSSDLDQVAIRELGSIVEAAGSQSNTVNVAVQLDLHGVKGTLRLLAGPDSKVQGQFGDESDAADPDTLQKFLEWATKYSPSEHYLLIFWGHSSGPVVFVGDFELPDPASPEKPAVSSGAAANVLGPVFSAAFNGNGRGSFRRADGRPGLVKKVGGAIKKQCHHFERAKYGSRGATNGRRGQDPVVDIVLFKECFMGTLETAFELDHVKYMISSQGKVPRLNWPYKEMFTCLAEHAEPGEAADGILNALGEHYEIGRNRRGKDHVPIALVDVPLAQQLAKEYVPKLVEELQAAGDADRRKAIESALDRSALGDPALLDVKLLCRNLASVPGDSSQGLRAAASGLAKLFEAAPNGNGGLPPVRLARRDSMFGGVSVMFFPHPLDALGPVHVGGSFIAPVVARYPERYTALDFAKTGWTSIALKRLAGWKGNILESFGDGKTLDYRQLEEISKVSALGDILGRPTDLDLDKPFDFDIPKPFDFNKPFDFLKPFDFNKPFDFSKPFDFAKMLDFVKAIDFAKPFDFGANPSS